MKLSVDSSCFFLLASPSLRQIILTKLLSLFVGFASFSVLSIVTYPGEAGVVWAVKDSAKAKKPASCFLRFAPLKRRTKNMTFSSDKTTTTAGFEEDPTKDTNPQTITSDSDQTITSNSDQTTKSILSLSKMSSNDEQLSAEGSRGPIKKNVRFADDKPDVIEPKVAEKLWNECRSKIKHCADQKKQNPGTQAKETKGSHSKSLKLGGDKTVAMKLNAKPIGDELLCTSDYLEKQTNMPPDRKLVEKTLSHNRPVENGEKYKGGREEPVFKRAESAEGAEGKAFFEKLADGTIAITEPEDFTANLLDNPKLFLINPADKPVTFDSTVSDKCVKEGNESIFSDGLPLGWYVPDKAKFTVEFKQSKTGPAYSKISWNSDDFTDRWLKLINYNVIDPDSEDNHDLLLFGIYYKKPARNNRIIVEAFAIADNGEEYELFDGALVIFKRVYYYDYIAIPKDYYKLMGKFRLGFRIDVSSAESICIIDTFLTQGKADYTQYDPIGAAYGKYASKRMEHEYVYLLQEFATKLHLGSFKRTMGTFVLREAINPDKQTVFCMDEKTRKSYKCTPVISSEGAEGTKNFQVETTDLLEGKMMFVTLPKWVPFESNREAASDSVEQAQGTF